MKSLLQLLITLPLLTACQDSDNKTTELEGLWESDCIIPFSTFSTETVQNSTNISMLFKDNNIDINLKTYTDNQCTILESTVPAGEAPNGLFADNATPVSFVIGNSITASNGLPAKEIDFILENGEIQLLIYQLQDNNNSLYFGGPCIDVQSLGGNTCIEERPIDIGTFKYSRQ